MLPIVSKIKAYSNIIVSTNYISNQKTSNIAFSPSNASVGLQISLLLSIFLAAFAGPFLDSFDYNWGQNNSQILNNGDLLTLSLNKECGSDFVSKNQYVYAKIDMNIKLVAGNSAGTVTAYYVKIMHIAIEK
ncbi:hypothetical protein SO802_000396 [Lithocarpus litseifolius]|uniref:GH16 domain-containing protein n=1 Tax=Lithocarpus litseifolius TaxID=425828 RepID=A0AAW2DRH0_9ROSI